MAMSKFDTGRGGIGTTPFTFVNAGSRDPLNAMNTQKDGMMGNGDTASRHANRMQEGINTDRLAQGPSYFKDLVNVGPGMLRDKDIIIETVWRLRTKRPDSHTHPFLSGILKYVEVGPDIRGMMAKSIDLIISEPILVGTHTGGPTFAMQSTGAFATTISVALSHKFATKTLRAARGMELYMQFLMASMVSFDEYREGIIISVLKNVSNKPLSVASYENRQNHLFSIDDVVGDFLDTFAIINTNPTGVFERIHYLCTKRLNDLGVRNPDLYIATKEHFAGQRLFGVAGNLQQSGEQGQRNLQDKLVQPTLTADGGSVKCYTLEYYTAPLSRQHILLQNATIGSFCSQKIAVGTSGTARYFHGHDTTHEVPLRRALENIRMNFMTKKGDDYVFKKISADYFNKDLDESEDTSLLAMAGGKHISLKQKMESIVGFIVDGNGEPLETIGDIDEKFLPEAYIKRWFLEYLKDNHAIVALATKKASTTEDGLKDTASSSSESEPSGLKRSINEILGRSSSDSAEILARDRDGNTLQVDQLYDFIFKKIKEGEPLMFGNSAPKDAKMAWDRNGWLSAYAGKALEFTSGGKGYSLEESGDLAKQVDSHLDILPTFKQLFENNDLPDDIANTAIGKELKKLKKGKSSPTKKPSSGDEDESESDRSPKRPSVKKTRTSDDEMTQKYYDTRLTYKSLVELLDNGFPLPYKIVLWAPNIVYSGFPIVGVASGEPGYFGMDTVYVQEREVDNKQTTIELDATLLMFVDQPNAIARRDLTVVTDVKSKDYQNTWLVVNKAEVNHAKGDFQWVSEPSDNQGSLFATFDSWTNDIHPISSFFGYHFLPKNFLDPVRIRQNQTWHHMMAPQVLSELQKIFGTQIKNEKSSTMFRRDHYLGIPGFCCRESSYTVMNDGSRRFHGESKLWPADEGMMNNSLKRRTAMGRIPNSITEKDY